MRIDQQFRRWLSGHFNGEQKRGFIVGLVAAYTAIFEVLVWLGVPRNLIVAAGLGVLGWYYMGRQDTPQVQPVKRQPLPDPDHHQDLNEHPDPDLDRAELDVDPNLE